MRLVSSGSRAFVVGVLVLGATVSCRSAEPVDASRRAERLRDLVIAVQDLVDNRADGKWPAGDLLAAVRESNPVLVAPLHLSDGSVVTYELVAGRSSSSADGGGVVLREVVTLSGRAVASVDSAGRVEFAPAVLSSSPHQ